MVVLTAPHQAFVDTSLSWFDSLVDRLLQNQATPTEFVAKFFAGITDRFIESAAARLPLLGRQCTDNYGEYHSRFSPFQLSLQFLHAMAFRAGAGTGRELAQRPDQYLDILTNFDCCWSTPDEVHAIAEQLDEFVHHEIRGPYAGPGSEPSDCLRHCLLVFRVLDWHIGALCTLAKQNPFDVPLRRLFLDLIGAIRRFRTVPFSALLLFVFFSQISNKAPPADDQMVRLLDRLNECFVQLKREANGGEEKGHGTKHGDGQTADDDGTTAMEMREEEEQKQPEEDAEEKGRKRTPPQQQQKEHHDEDGPSLADCVRELGQLVDTFADFATPPPANCWLPFRENFIHRRHRPAILTLASVYAIYRVLKSADEVADAFLTLSQVLGMSHEQMVKDLLRAGFLIQLETVSSSVDGDRREREALADVFVFFKLPQVLSKMLSRGVPRASVTAALGHLCASASLLDELDAKKSDNMFRFFMDALRRADIVGQSDHEALVLRRDADRGQNDELLQQLRSTIVGISSSATTAAEAAQMVKARSELINRVQKAKSAIDRVVPEKTEEMLRKLIPHEVPIDMLCSIYSASGELSQFSGWLAALNAQTQMGGTNEGVDAVASSPQGRLLLFDSTFLLMARIQAVFPDLRLEELVGARVHCTFFLWNKRYANCVENGEPMTMPASGSILRDGTVVDDDFFAYFRANQFSAMRDNKTPFWSAEHSDFGTVLELVPLVGELLLDEFQQQSAASPRAEGMEAVNNVLCSFRHLSSLWLCLVQWLDTQPMQEENSAKQLLARAMREFEIDWHKKQPTAHEKDSGHERLGYSMFLARRTLKQLAEPRVKKEHPYTWLIGFAQRPLPALPVRKLSMLRTDKDELKEEKQRLKEVFLCANQQGWASPNAVAHVNRCNVSLGMDIWLHCWLGQMLNQTRIATVDEGELAVELCLATAFTYPVPCLCEMIKQLVECVLFVPSASQTRSSSTTAAAETTTTTTAKTPTAETGGVDKNNDNKSGTTVPPQQQHSTAPTCRHPIVGELSPKATVMARMLVRALQLLLWAGERSVLGKREREKRLQQIYGTTGDGTCRKRRHQSAQSSAGAATVSNALNAPPTTNVAAPSSASSSSSAGGGVGTEPMGSDGSSGGEEQKAAPPVVANSGSATAAASVAAATPPPPRPSSQPHHHKTLLTATASSSAVTYYSKQQQAALDVVRNVFERFNRIVRDCTLRPPVTFIIFFLHELAQAPRTPYWRQLVDMMPIELMFVLGRLDPSALPLGLFLRIYDPSDERHWDKCVQYAMLVSRK
ncbi:hypothetical protein niasHS_001413 [Heterodera schachtii]|uniref:Mediator of RNA polymerase II transcription subunit 24 n=1 Tax=Heterodera schachtii TaxID=97005 RepID=A0ABD2KDC9_HETSC